LRQHQAMVIPLAQGQAFLADFLSLPQYPRLTLPPELQYEEVALVPQPQITLRPQQHFGWTDRVCGEGSFNYGGRIVPHDHTGGGVYEAETRRLLLRNRAVEHEALATLPQLGFTAQRY